MISQMLNNQSSIARPGIRFLKNLRVSTMITEMISGGVGAVSNTRLPLLGKNPSFGNPSKQESLCNNFALTFRASVPLCARCKGRDTRPGERARASQVHQIFHCNLQAQEERGGSGSIVLTIVAILH
jgi:hypothetical protein